VARLDAMTRQLNQIRAESAAALAQRDAQLAQLERALDTQAAAHQQAMTSLGTRIDELRARLR